MQLTRQQFTALAPHATAATVDALFALNADDQPTIQRILDEHQIIEPHVVAQFFAGMHIASEGFREFGQVEPLPPVVWLTQGAREWYDCGSNRPALDWRWSDVMDGKIIELLGLASACWPEARLVLPDVCAALGIEDRSDVAMKILDSENTGAANL